MSKINLKLSFFHTFSSFLKVLTSLKDGFPMPNKFFKSTFAAWSSFKYFNLVFKRNPANT
jgi:hypothetical protein